MRSAMLSLQIKETKMTQEEIIAKFCEETFPVLHSDGSVNHTMLSLKFCVSDAIKKFLKEYSTELGITAKSEQQEIKE